MKPKEVKEVLGIQENNSIMVKRLTVLLSFVGLMFSCVSAGKVQKNQPLVGHLDTTLVNLKSDSNKLDSLAFVKEVYSKVLKNKINFSTFSAKVKVAYKTNDEENDANMYVRIIKDSIIWLSVRGPLGIEVARVLVTTDSVKVINYLEKSIQFEGIGYLEQLSGLPFDFTALQDAIIGNPVFIDSNITSFNTNENKQLSLIMLGSLFIHEALLDSGDYKILESKLANGDLLKQRNCTIAYNGYENEKGVFFSTQRDINITGSNEMDVNMEFKSYSFNQEVSFPFSIPKNYKR